MANPTRSGLRRGLAAAVLGITIAVATGMMVGVQHASAQAIPNKSCTGGGPSQEAEPGDQISCVISASGALFDGSSVSVKPMAPTGASIPNGGCTGQAAPGSGGMPSYSTTVPTTGNGGSSGVCTFVLHVTTPSPLPGAPTPVLGNIVLGTERLTIPRSTTVGTSVTQTAQECPPPAPAPLTMSCSSPFLPMGVSGPGSCVGGSAVPVLGGCASLPLPLPSSSPSATTSPSGNGGLTAGGDTSSQPPGGVQAAATTTTTTKTPFTGGPEHPLPVGAALVAAGGALLAFLAGAGPALFRRRRDI